MKASVGRLFQSIACLGLLVASLGHAGTGSRDFGPFSLDTTGDPTLREIGGTVSDSYNHIGIPGVEVRFDNQSGAVAIAVTGSAGTYQITGLDPDLFAAGSYQATLTFLNVPQSPSPYKPLIQLVTLFDQPMSQATDFELTTNTVILLHGILSSSHAWEVDDPSTGDSFVQALWSAGFYVVAPEYSWWLGFTRGSDEIAAELATQLHMVGVQSYHVVAHSLGGLVARQYSAGPQGYRRIDKLVTLGTPHHGTGLATAISASWTAIRAVLSAVKQANPIANIVIPATAPFQLADEVSPGSIALNALNYNASMPEELVVCATDRADESTYGTTVYSIAGTHPCDWWVLGKLLEVFGNDCEDDGVIPVSSARFWASPYFYRDDNQGIDCPVEHRSASLFCTKHMTNNTCLAEKVVAILSGDAPPPSALPSATRDTKGATGSPGLQLLPIRNLLVPAGAIIMDSVTVSPATSYFSVAWEDSAPGILYSLISPEGVVVDQAYADTSASVDASASPYGDAFIVSAAAGGYWTQVVDGSTLAAPTSVVTLIGYESLLELDADATSEVEPSGAFDVHARLVDAGAVLPLARVFVEVQRPDSSAAVGELLDDGVSPDSLSGDGVYSGTVAAQGQEGTFLFEVTATADATDPLAAKRQTFATGRAQVLPDVGVRPGGFVLPDSIVFGAQVSVSAVFENVGTIASDSTILRVLSVSFNEVLAETTLVLDAGATDSLTVDWIGLVPGNVELRATAETLGGRDRSVTNNVASRSVFVQAPPVSDVATGVPLPHGWESEDPERASFRLDLAQSRPNPTTDNTITEFTISDRPEPVHLAVFNVAGRRVRTLVSGRLEEGRHAVSWDSRDDDGHPVGTGIYFIRIEHAGDVRVRKITILR